MLKRDITFIYSDSAEKSFMDLLAKEAEERGYTVTVTDDPFARCEIGVYCQHVNFPKYSKKSMIMLHDIIQQYSNWPDIWLREPWNKYDVGILPSDQWVENWNQCSQFFYARPKMGMFKVGWPKADLLAHINASDHRKLFYEKYGLDSSKKTVLYAPAWENDHKQDDFVQAMLPLGVNVLIKQWDADPEKFPQVVKNIKEMEELHCKMENVTVLPPSMNIFEAILASDVLVSEESSTMCEAIMVGVPAISVSDWLIPDVTPSRYPKCDYDFVVKTTKSELSECANEVLIHYDEYKKQAEEYSKKNFSNVGSTCNKIMDIADDLVTGGGIRYTPIAPKTNQKVPFKTCLYYHFKKAKICIRDNFCERHLWAKRCWTFARSIKRMLKGEAV